MTSLKSDFTAFSYNKNYCRSISEFKDPKMPKNYSVERFIYDLKIILIGNSGVGKTSLLVRFLGEDFNTNYKCTLAIESLTKILSIDACTGVNLKI